ncbi:MAG TPA: sporulation protein YpjB [Firmicutes bacterium]|mgnify:CR=1 FL=1|nr:sporulation protein YpjB [Bacillota bacterium]
MKKWLFFGLCIGWGSLLYFGFQMISHTQKINIDEEIKQLDQVRLLLAHQKIDAASKQLYHFFESFPQQAISTSDAQKMFYLMETESKQRFIYDASHIEQLEKEVLKLYLFVDALQSEGKPLWIGQLEKMNTLCLNLQLDATNLKNWHQLQEMYTQIYPCLYMYASPMLLQRINNHMEDLDFYDGNQYTQDHYKEILKDLHADFSYFTKGDKKDGFDFSFYLLLFFTGGTIFSTLTYVAIRKYQAEKRKEKLPVRSKDL